MKIIIIGAGVASQTVIESILRNQNDFELDIYTDESYPYYSRVFLPNYIAGERTKDKLFIRKESWYNENHIQLHKKEKIIGIDLKNKHIQSQTGETISYDKLILALGSSARKLDFGNPNHNLKGNFALRTIADAENIQNYIKQQQVEKAFIIGGGLLGIELGFHLKKLIKQVQICEIAPHLLPRQLDEETSKILKQYLESQGLEFILGESVEKIIGKSKVEGVITQSGVNIDTHLVLQQLGIIPNIELAKSAGLKTNKGILVNEFMQTSDPNVYAVGDCIEFDGKIWGIIPASMEQAKQAASHLLNQNPDPYKPSVWNTRLKIAGIDLTCIGLSSPEADQGATLFEYKRQDTYTCRKVLIRNDVLTNAILLGPGADTKYFMKKAGKHVNPEEVKEKINE